jgi:hypothetical protein
MQSVLHDTVMFAHTFAQLARFVEPVCRWDAAQWLN